MRSLFLYLAGLLLSFGLSGQFTFNGGPADYLTGGIHWGGPAPTSGANADITINSGTCIINAGPAIFINNLTISPGATLRINGTTVFVAGTLQQNGNLQFSSASTIFVQGDYLGFGQLDLAGTISTLYLNGANNAYTGTVVGNTSGKFVYERNGTQSILRINYYKLIISGSDVKSLGTGGSINVNDSLVIQGGASFDFSASVLAYGDIENRGTLTSSNTSFCFFGSNEQNITGNGIFNFNTFFINKPSGSVHHKAPSIIRVNNQFNFSSGKLILENGDVELTQSGTFNGTFGPNGMIETNVGSFIRSASTVSGLISVGYPLGVSGTYHPVGIATASGGGTGGIKIKINNSACVNCANKFVDLSTVGSLTISDISFKMQFAAGDIIGTKPTRVMRDATIVFNPDTNTVANPHYFGYTGNLTAVGGLNGSWRFLGGFPIITRIERRSNPGTSASSVCQTEKVAIVGQNFGGITNLTFFGTSIAAYTVSATNDTIYIDGFPISGGGNVEVTTANGSATVPLFVMASPNPTTIFTTPASSVCSNLGAQFLIPLGEAATTYQILLNNLASSAQITTVTAGAESLVVPPVEMIVPGIYTVQLKMSKGTCIDTSNTTLTVTVFAAPSISSPTFPLNSTSCPLNMNYAPLVSNFDAVSWTSSGSGGFNNTNTTNVVYSPSPGDKLLGGVDITITATKAGCPDLVRTNSVTLIPAPTAMLATGEDTVCAGSPVSINLYMTGVAPFDGLSLQLSTGGSQDLASQTVDTTTVSVIPTGGTPIIYSLIEQASFFVDANGCRGTVSGTHTVVPETPPTSFMSDTITICQSAVAAISLTITGKFPVDIDISNGTDIFSGTANTGSLIINATPSVTGNFTVVSMSTSHCPAGSGVSTGNFRVMVTPSANPATPLSSIGDTLCAGETVQLGISTQAGISYIASLSGTDLNAAITGTGGVMNIPLVFGNALIPAGTSTIIIKATGCVTDTLNQTFQLLKSALPDNFALDIPNGNVLCNNTPVVLSTSLSAPYTMWRLGVAEIIAASGSSYTVLTPGTYQLMLKDNVGCTSLSIPVDVNFGGSQPSVTINNISGYESELTASAGTGYSWYAKVGGRMKKIMDEIGSVYSAYYDGSYFVSVKHNTCIIFSDSIEVSGKQGGLLSKQSFAMSDSTITIPRLNWEDPVAVYPNPIQEGGEVTLRYMNTRGASIKAELYTSEGNLVRSASAAGQGMIYVTFDTFGLKPGLYFLKLDDGIKIQGSNLIIN